MARGIIGQFAMLAVAFLVVAAIAAFAVGRAATESASAQAQPTMVGSIVQLPPPVPGLDYSPSEPGQATIPDAITTAGTPVAPPATDALAPASGESITASLGGSDISVSSVGGSYERDGPKRRGDRSPRR